MSSPLANRMLSLAEELRVMAVAVDSPARSRDGGTQSPATANVHAIMRARRLREQFFPGGLFADPAWDMILDLVTARYEGRRISVSSLCIASGVPPTTALRWIGQLTRKGVFRRVQDETDGRRVFIELSDEAAEGFTAWAQAVGVRL